MREKPPVWDWPHEPDYREEMGRIAMRHFQPRRWWRSIDWQVLFGFAMYTLAIAASLFCGWQVGGKVVHALKVAGVW